MPARWPGTRLAPALDATSLGDRLTTLAVSIVYTGCAVPVAWQILPANRKRAWTPEWLALLALLAPAVPAGWEVIVLTDRGLYARPLSRAIVGHGWHPFMPVNVQGTFHPAGSDRRQPLAELAIRRLRRHYQPRLGASPAVIFLGECYAVLPIEELLDALGATTRDSLLPAPRRKPPE